eukprot:m.83044 g.83044  ORF g.83044 m.83044 type:complete len:568 (+) comp36325_c0_seq4:142-1845(+)
MGCCESGLGQGEAPDIVIDAPSSEAYRSSSLPQQPSLLRPQARKPASFITIIHFNDVYNVDSRQKEPVGGAAKFVTKVRSLADKNPLVLFSGDCLSPSTRKTRRYANARAIVLPADSNVTRGEHMVPVLNAAGVEVAVYGNHDFDFGVDNLESVAGKTTAVWLLSNVTDSESKEPLAGGKVTTILQWEGHKIGFMGLIEKDWLDTLATVSPENVIYTDFAEQGIHLAQQLRAEGAELVIALTHMRQHNDMDLARKARGHIDLVLGGHDHFYEVKNVDGVLVCKSGTDFRAFTEVRVSFDGDLRDRFQTVKHEVKGDVPDDKRVVKELKKYSDSLNLQMEETLDVIDFELEGRFSEVRTKETNLGNLVADVMRQVTKADVALINSGTLRSDAIHGPGPIKLKDLMDILPMPDSLVVIEVKGDVLLSALKNSVSHYPQHEGRFPQISGMTFSFKPSAPPCERIDPSTVTIQSDPLDLTKTYTVCVKSYIADGKDGYVQFVGSKRLLDVDNGPILPAIMLNHLQSVAVKRGVKRRKSLHMQDPNLKTPSVRGVSSVYYYPEVEGRITTLE